MNADDVKDAREELEAAFTAAAPRLREVPGFAAGAKGRRERRRIVTESSSPVLAMLIGDAIGDAFGFGIEMQDASWIREKVTRFDCFPDSPVLPAEHRVNNVRGFYSDDTEMTVGLMKGLVRSGVELDEAGMWQAWSDEWDIAKARAPPAEPGGERAGHGVPASLTIQPHHLWSLF
jgi:hypothetical protein